MSYIQCYGRYTHGIIDMSFFRRCGNCCMYVGYFYFLKLSFIGQLQLYDSISTNDWSEISWVKIYGRIWILWDWRPTTCSFTDTGFLYQSFLKSFFGNFQNMHCMGFCFFFCFGGGGRGGRGCSSIWKSFQLELNFFTSENFDNFEDYWIFSKWLCWVYFWN